MKSRLLLLAICIYTLSAIAVFGQTNIKFGTHAGLNIANFSSSEIDYEFRPGFTAGVSAEVELEGQPFNVETGLYYTQKGAKGIYRDPFEVPCCNAGNAGTLKTDYVDIPLLALFIFERSGSFHPEIIAGPYVAINISSKIQEADDIYIEKIDDFVNTIDAGLLFGGGGVLRLNSLNLRFRATYGFGLSSVFNNDVDSDEKHRVFNISAGILF